MNSKMQIEYKYIDGIIDQLFEMNLKDLSKLLICVSQEIINRKFMSDLHFGLIKHKFRQSDCQSILDL